MRPVRSVLYLPASNPRALEKARSLPVDAIIFDLEDAVAPAAKAEARAALGPALAADHGRRLRIVERTPTSLTVRARTERQEFVTIGDLDLAARFDDLVATVGSAA